MLDLRPLVAVVAMLMAGCVDPNGNPWWGDEVGDARGDPLNPPGAGDPGSLERSQEVMDGEPVYDPDFTRTRAPDDGSDGSGSGVDGSDGSGSGVDGSDGSGSGDAGTGGAGDDPDEGGGGQGDGEGANDEDADCNLETSGETVGTPVNATGTVEHVEIEGGFYGIVGDDGRRYDPMNLCQEFMVDGLRVTFTGRIRDDVVSFHMWGNATELVTIRRA